MHSLHFLVSSHSLSSSQLLSAACAPFHHRSSKCQPLSSPGLPKGGRNVEAATLFASHLRTKQQLRAHSLQGTSDSSSKSWEVTQPWNPRQTQGLSRVLFWSRQLGRTRSQADTEAGSLEDLNLDDLNDEQLDALFENYGEVVKGESEPASTSSEVDDDAESLSFAVALAEIANEVKAGEIQVLCVKPLVYWTRFFVIATGFSRPQVDAIGKRMRDMAEERYKKTPRGDLKPNAWTLLDFGDVVVHIFYPKERLFYNLEEFYGNATAVELPFETQSKLS